MSDPSKKNPASDDRRPMRMALVWIAILLVVGVGIALNIDRLKSLRNAATEVLQLRRAVQEKFDVKDVSINLHRSGAGNRLSVELANPPFEELSDPELAAKAKEIATLAYRNFGADHDYRQISVVIIDKPDSVITIAEKREFQFTAEELVENEEEAHTS